jgi:hypothetical protein
MASLDNMTLAELEDLAAKLKAEIARDPQRMLIAKVKLQDVNQWIALRRKELQPGARISFPHPCQPASDR